MVEKTREQRAEDFIAWAVKQLEAVQNRQDMKKAVELIITGAASAIARD